MLKMIELVEKLPTQMTEAIEIGSKAVFNKHSAPIRSVFVTGMGGSGIGAGFAEQFAASELKVPFKVCKGYHIPKWVNKHTLAIVSSYSGNTEETLSCYQQLLGTGCKIVCVASGGKVIAMAKELGHDFIQVPGNWPSPRACLGYSFIQQLYILQGMKLISGRAIRQVTTAISFLEKNQDSIRKEAAKIAAKLHGRIPVIYTEDRMESVGLRFRQQVNENSKCLSWSGVVPEMNHNELVGWKGPNDQFVAIYFRNVTDFDRNAVRMNINQEVIARSTSAIINVYSKGKNDIERALYHVFLGDFISCYLCDHRGYDSIEIEVIDYLKGELGKI
jgi:glucose/mannose-6-phosphate isomerase